MERNGMGWIKRVATLFLEKLGETIFIKKIGEVIGFMETKKILGVILHVEKVLGVS